MVSSGLASAGSASSGSPDSSNAVKKTTVKEETDTADHGKTVPLPPANPNKYLPQYTVLYSINSLDMEKVKTWIDKNTIVFIDMDHVIMTPESLMFHYTSPYQGLITNLIDISKRKPSYKNIVAKWYQQRKLKLIEPEWVDFINYLKNRDIDVYGICDMPIRLENIEQKRYLESKELGISFTDKAAGQEVLIINNSSSWPSLFYKGIIFTGGFNKADTMTDFIKLNNIFIKKIVFFSKQRDSSKKIEIGFKNLGVSYYNVIYLKENKIPGKPIPEVMQFQKQKLMQQGVWLEDEAAAQMLKMQGGQGK